MRPFWKNEDADGYLIIIFIVSLLIFGGVYAMVSDIRDATALEIYSNLAPLGNSYNDADTLWGFDMLNMFISFSIVFFLISIIYYIWNKTQEPQAPY